jgi:hypothetical protein
VQVIDAAQPVAQLGRADLDDQGRRVGILIPSCLEFRLARRRRQDPRIACGSRSVGMSRHRAAPVRDPLVPGAGVRRARVLLSPRGRRLAALLGRPSGIRIRRPNPAAGREGWVEAWVRIGSIDAATLDMLALGAEVEVIHPPELRMQVGQTARRIAGLHSARGDGERP